MSGCYERWRGRAREERRSVVGGQNGLHRVGSVRIVRMRSGERLWWGVIYEGGEVWRSGLKGMMEWERMNRERWSWQDDDQGHEGGGRVSMSVGVYLVCCHRRGRLVFEAFRLVKPYPERVRLDQGKQMVRERRPGA